MPVPMPTSSTWASSGRRRSNWRYHEDVVDETVLSYKKRRRRCPKEEEGDVEEAGVGDVVET